MGVYFDDTRILVHRGHTADYHNKTDTGFAKTAPVGGKIILL